VPSFSSLSGSRRSPALTDACATVAKQAAIAASASQRRLDGRAIPNSSNKDATVIPSAWQ
jgi:hypothetical protein